MSQKTDIKFTNFFSTTIEDILVGANIVRPESKLSAAASWFYTLNGGFLECDDEYGFYSGMRRRKFFQNIVGFNRSNLAYSGFSYATYSLETELPAEELAKKLFCSFQEACIGSPNKTKTIIVHMPNGRNFSMSTAAVHGIRI